jgi:hypothetical protein
MRPAGYRWAAISNEGGGTYIVCHAGGHTQAVADFVPAEVPTVHHDAELVDLTHQVNTLLAPYQGRQLDDGRHLAKILTPDGWMFAWTRNEHGTTLEQALRGRGGVRAITLEDSSDDDIRRALGLAAR